MLVEVETQQDPPVVNYYQPSLTDQEVTDFKVKDLSRGGQLTLWCVRHWVKNRMSPMGCSVSIDKTFGLAGIPEAADLLDEFMTLLARTAMRPVRIDRPCARTLSSDEFLMLGAMRLLQKGRTDTARRSVARVLHGRLADAFCRSTAAYAELLAQVDLKFDRMTTLSVAHPMEVPRQCQS